MCPPCNCETHMSPSVRWTHNALETFRESALFFVGLINRDDLNMNPGHSKLHGGGGGGGGTLTMNEKKDSCAPSPQKQKMIHHFVG